MRCLTWTSQTEELLNKQALRFTISLHSRPATFADAPAGWQNDAFSLMVQPAICRGSIHIGQSIY